MKKMIAIVMVIVIISQVPVFGEESHELNIDSKSCVLMESSTGMVLYENNQNEKLSPASITKIMTLILIFDAIHSGKIKLTDVATTMITAAAITGSGSFFSSSVVDAVTTTAAANPILTSPMGSSNLNPLVLSSIYPLSAA